MTPSDILAASDLNSCLELNNISLPRKNERNAKSSLRKLAATADGPVVSSAIRMQTTSGLISPKLASTGLPWPVPSSAELMDVTGLPVAVPPSLQTRLTDLQAATQPTLPTMLVELPCVTQPSLPIRLVELPGAAQPTLLTMPVERPAATHPTLPTMLVELPAATQPTLPTMPVELPGATQPSLPIRLVELPAATQRELGCAMCPPLDEGRAVAPPLPEDGGAVATSAAAGGTTAIGTGGAAGTVGDGTSGTGADGTNTAGTDNASRTGDDSDSGTGTDGTTAAGTDNTSRTGDYGNGGTSMDVTGDADNTIGTGGTTGAGAAGAGRLLDQNATCVGSDAARPSADGSVVRLSVDVASVAPAQQRRGRERYKVLLEERDPSPLVFPAETRRQTLAEEDCRRHYILLLTKAGVRSKSWMCGVCGRQLGFLSLLMQHVQAHHLSVPQFQCDVCQSSFKTRMALAQHRSGHAHQRPLACSVCQQRFYRRSVLTRHQRAHSGDKPFVCHCGKRFLQKGNLTVHERTHQPKRGRPAGSRGRPPARLRPQLVYRCLACGDQLASFQLFIDHKLVCKPSLPTLLERNAAKGRRTSPPGHDQMHKVNKSPKTTKMRLQTRQRPQTSCQLSRGRAEQQPHLLSNPSAQSAEPPSVHLSGQPSRPTCRFPSGLPDGPALGLPSGPLSGHVPNFLSGVPTGPPSGSSSSLSGPIPRLSGLPAEPPPRRQLEGQPRHSASSSLPVRPDSDRTPAALPPQTDPLPVIFMDGSPPGHLSAATCTATWTAASRPLRTVGVAGCAVGTLPNPLPAPLPGPASLSGQTAEPRQPSCLLSDRGHCPATGALSGSEVGSLADLTSCLPCCPLLDPLPDLQCSQAADPTSDSVSGFVSGPLLGSGSDPLSNLISGPLSNSISDPLSGSVCGSSCGQRLRDQGPPPDALPSMLHQPYKCKQMSAVLTVSPIQTQSMRVARASSVQPFVLLQSDGEGVTLARALSTTDNRELLVPTTVDDLQSLQLQQTGADGAAVVNVPIVAVVRKFYDAEGMHVRVLPPKSEVPGCTDLVTFRVDLRPTDDGRLLTQRVPSGVKSGQSGTSVPPLRSTLPSTKTDPPTKTDALSTRPDSILARAGRLVPTPDSAPTGAFPLPAGHDTQRTGDTVVQFVRQTPSGDLETVSVAEAALLFSQPGSSFQILPGEESSGVRP